MIAYLRNIHRTYKKMLNEDKGTMISDTSMASAFSDEVVSLLMNNVRSCLHVVTSTTWTRSRMPSG